MRETTAPDAMLRTIRGYRNAPTNVASLTYGRRMEGRALAAYQKWHSAKCGCHVDVSPRGLYINHKTPYLGTSLDGYVTCENCGTGIVEVKCPFGRKQQSWRHMTPSECCQSSQFCCSLKNGHPALRVTHSYYYQVMGQLAIYELPWDDFVIWTKKGLAVERIYFDAMFWQSMLNILRPFYVKNVVAELYTQRVRRGKPLYD